LSPNEGTAVVYHWKWYQNVPTLALWVILGLAIVLVKANRNHRALLIMLPLLVVGLLWLGFVRLLNFPSVARVQYDPLFVSYTVGIAVLWLFAHKLGNRNRFVTFLLALLVMIVVGFVGLASYSMDIFSDETTMFLAFLIILALSVLVGYVLAALLCRKRYSGLRFMLWLALWVVVNSVAAMLTFMVIMFLIQGNLPNDLTSMLLQVLVVGLVAGLLLYAINLPFMILSFCSSFFRERFYACLRLKSMPKTAGAGVDDNRLNGQNSEAGASENNDSA
jgi:hypothetical protein